MAAALPVAIARDAAARASDGGHVMGGSHARVVCLSLQLGRPFRMIDGLLTGHRFDAQRLAARSQLERPLIADRTVCFTTL
jgi:hypothetical protein